MEPKDLIFITRDQLINWLYEAGVIPPGYGGTEAQFQALETFASLAMAHQRELDAKLCESQEDFEYATGKVDHNERSWCSYLAEAIRGSMK